MLHYKADLSTAQVEDAVQSLSDVRLELVPPSAAVMRRAVIIAREYNTTMYNGTFATLAKALNATFVTVNERPVRHLKRLPRVRFLGMIATPPASHRHPFMI